MIIEKIESQEESVTKDGWTVTRVYLSTWNEWLDQTGELEINDEGVTEGFDFPRIGEILFDRENLVVTNIDVAASRQSVDYCTVTITYSTEGAVAKEKEANQINSWEERLSISTQQVSAVGYIDKDGNYKVWETEWLASSPVGGVEPTLDNIQDLTKQEPAMSYTITGYGSDIIQARVLDEIAKINTDQFLKVVADDVTGAIPGSNVPGRDVSSFQDQKKWLFVGCNSTRIKQGVYEYEFTFEYKAEGWNTFQGVETDMYKLTDLRALLSGLDNTDDDPWNNGGSAR